MRTVLHLSTDARDHASVGTPVPDNIRMTEYEPQHDHGPENVPGNAQYDGGSAAANDAQTYGGGPSATPPSYGSQPPAYAGQPPAYGGQPPAYASEPAYAPGFGNGDVIVAGPQGKRRLAPVITSVIAVLAIVLAGGGFTAYKLLASKGDQPDKWVPGNAIAYAKIDLDPSASAKVAAWEFEKKFPDAPKIASADDLKDGLLRAIFTPNDGSSDINYDRDIKPWLGDRVGIAAFIDSQGKPQGIGVLSVKDAAKARAGIEKLNASSDPGSGAAYSIQGDYVIIGGTQAIVDEAVAAARKSNIGSNSTYTSDVAHLKGDRVVTGWWDIGATLKAASSILPDNAGSLLMSGGLTGLPDMSKAGRMVMGVRVQPSDVEVEGRVLGSSTTGTLDFKDGDAGATLGELPGGTVAGVALANPEQIVKTELDALKKGVLGAGLQSELDAAGAQLGIALPGDLENLLGSDLALGLNSVPDSESGFGSALLTLLTHPDDVAKALQTAKILAATASADGNLSLTASAQGHTLVLTNDDKPATGKLADDPAFKNALAGMPQKAAVAGFVNLSAILAAQPDAPAAAKHLDGLGFYVGVDATSPVFSLKLTVK